MGAATMSGISRALKQLLLPLVIALALVAIVQFRMTRFGLENTPYRKLFDSHSTLSTLKEEEGGRPFRVGTLSMMPAVVQMYGAETVDGRGPLQPKYYKDYFREIIRPQLRKESYLDFFDNYWFHLYLRDSKFFQESADASNGELLLRIPLLLMINTKYLVSWNRDPYLEGVSEKVMEVKGDNIIKPSLMDRAMQKVDLIARIPILGAFVEQRLKRDGARSLFESVYCQTLFVYKLKGAFERGYLARNAIVLPSDREVLRSLTTKTQELVRGTVLFSAEDAAVANDLLKKGVPLGNNGKGDAVDIAYYSPDRIVFNGIASSPCFLVVTNNYHPNWSATVNGEKAKIYRANHAFQAISIEHVGKFRAVFEYNDPLLWKTHYAVPFGLALIWISVFYPRSNRKCEQDTPAL
jgi:hypothetical protein